MIVIYIIFAVLILPLAAVVVAAVVTDTVYMAAYLLRLIRLIGKGKYYVKGK